MRLGSSFFEKAVKKTSSYTHVYELITAKSYESTCTARSCDVLQGADASTGTTPVVGTCGYTPPTHTFNNSNGVV